MKNIIQKIAFSLLFIGAFAAQVLAQPLPPSSPNGNPIPVGGISILALIAVGVYAAVRKEKK